MSERNKRTIGPGRWRGLRASSTVGNHFGILAFDQRGNYRKLLGSASSFETACAIKAQVVSVLSHHLSGVLLDYEYGRDSMHAVAGTTGILLCVEETGYAGDDTERRTTFDPHWNVGKIKRIGASGAKLLIYYNPARPEIAAEIDAVVSRIIDESYSMDIPIFVEPLSYSVEPSIAKGSEAFALLRPKIVIETVSCLSKLGPDVLKIEFPLDPVHDRSALKAGKLCEEISEASTCPWTLLSAGVDFDDYLEQYEIAAKSGASGYVAGRAIWKECIPMSTSARQEFLQVVAADRIHKLNEVTAKYARPWTDFYRPEPAGENWYRHYPDLCEQSGP
jgi:tagatose 1,6-diphosphate aldolase